MNEMIELRDAEVFAMSWADGVAIILLRSVRIHRSDGRPGEDAGAVWLQDVMFTVTNALLSIEGTLPATVQTGTLITGAELRQNIIPAAGVIAGKIKLELELRGGHRFVVNCDQLMIALTGEAQYLEKFEPASK